jgi:RND superfamily putative drug exporter
MTHLLHLATELIATKRGAWISLGIWAVLAVGLTVIAPRNPTPHSAMVNLPASAEASKADAAIAKDFSRSKGTPAAIVLYRRGGLAAADRTDAQSIARWLRSSAAPKTVVGVLDPLSARVSERAGLISKDRSTLVIQGYIADRGGNTLTDAVEAIRRHVGSGSGSGLEIRISGPAGIMTDLNGLTGNAANSLLLGAILVVLVILALVYRAPLLALLPVIAVGWAYAVANSLLTIGQHVDGTALNGQATASAPIVLFGLGTDYTLFIISRYRPELTRQPDAPAAMRRALRAVAEPVLASGSIVFLATLTLTLAALPAYHDWGPALATGVACVLLAGLTLIPALLTLFGRAAFWPSVPRFGHPEQPRVRIWSDLGSFVARRPVVATVLPIVFLTILATGVLQYKPRFAFLDSFLRTTDSLQGYDRLKQAFGPGSLAPTQVVVNSAAGSDAVRARLAVQRALSASPGVLSVTPAGTSRDGRSGLFEMQLRGDPYASGTIDLVPRLRAAARQAIARAGGGQVLIGGETATSYDSRVVSADDTRVVVAAVLVLISVVLGLFLRSILAPLYLLPINALSFGAAFGLVVYINDWILSSSTASVQLAVILFVFLAALGADYNIFLLSRVREEARSYPLNEAVRRSVASTGGVITSAGIVLAGTFSVLTTFPVRDAVEVGLGVALGVLLETFVVRSLLVPGVTLLIGRNAWWPSKLPARHEVEAKAA